MPLRTIDHFTKITYDDTLQDKLSMDYHGKILQIPNSRQTCNVLSQNA